MIPTGTVVLLIHQLPQWWPRLHINWSILASVMDTPFPHYLEIAGSNPLHYSNTIVANRAEPPQYCIIYIILSVWWGGRGGGFWLLTLLVAVRMWIILNMCYTWAGYDKMGAKYYHFFRGEWFQHKPPSVHISQPAHRDGLSGPSKKTEPLSNHWSNFVLFCFICKNGFWNSIFQVWTFLHPKLL